MAFSLEFFEAALGLAGFSLLMWVTIPWAFASTIESMTKAWEDKRRKERFRWLRIAEDSYLASGIFFSLCVVSESGITPSFSDVYSEYLLVIGFLAFGLAIAQTFLIVDFVSYPEVERTDLVTAVTYIGGLMLLMVIWGLNAIACWDIFKQRPLNLFGLLLDSLFLVGAIAPVRILQIYREENDVRARYLILLVLPGILYIFLVNGLGWSLV